MRDIIILYSAQRSGVPHQVRGRYMFRVDDVVRPGNERVDHIQLDDRILRWLFQ